MKKIVFFFAALFIINFSSCSKKNNPQISQAHKTTITATFYPLYIMLLNIAENVDVELNLLAPANTGCLHDFQLKTGDMKKIISSDIVVCNGSGMEDFIEKILDVKKQNVIIATENFPLVDENPHVWASVPGAIHMCKKITEGLCALDSKNKTGYEKNLQNYIQKLFSLYGNMKINLLPYAQNKIITFHEAFPYFALDFDFNLVGSIEREPNAEPSPKELKNLVDQIKNIMLSNEKIYLFAEPQYSPAACNVIASETKLKVFELDPCVSGSLEKSSYIDAMNKNLNVLLEAFGD